MKTVSKLIGGVALATALAATSACGSSASGGGGASSEFTMAINSALQGFDPYGCVGAKRDVLMSAYDTLVRQTPEGKYEPALAKSWSYETPTKFTMTLRDGVTFADGTPLNATVVKANLDRAAATPTRVTAQFAQDKPKITVDSDRTLTVNLGQADPDLENVFSFCGGMIVHPDLVANPGRMTNQINGTGPYSYNAATSISNSTYVFTKKDNYWDSAAYPFSKATFKIIPDYNAMVNAMASGQVDVAPGTAQTAGQAKSAGMTSIQANTNQFTILLNDRSGVLVPALKDVRVRQALNYAVDRGALTKTLFGEGSRATMQILRPEVAGYDASLNDRYAYDPDKARQLLADAGFADGFSMTVITAPINSFDTFLSAVANYWQKVGVKVQQKVEDPNSWLRDLSTKTYPATVYPLKGAPPFSALNQIFSPQSSFNPFGSTDPQYSKAMGIASAGGPGAAEALRAASTRLVDLAWYVGVGFDNVYYFFNPKKISGLKMQQDDSTPLFYNWKPAS